MCTEGLLCARHCSNYSPSSVFRDSFFPPYSVNVPTHSSWGTILIFGYGDFQKSIIGVSGSNGPHFLSSTWEIGQETTSPSWNELTCCLSGGLPSPALVLLPKDNNFNHRPCEIWGCTENRNHCQLLLLKTILS